MTNSLIKSLALGSALAIVGVSNLAMPASAQSTNAATCRTGYAILIDNQCIDYNTGHIELASAPSAPVDRSTSFTCRPDYVILIDNQCIDYKTGYIELALDKPGAPRTAQK